MTAAELLLPWRCFALDGLADWFLVLRRGRAEVVLTGAETLALCAAVELGRVHASTIDAHLARRRRQRRPWTIEQLVDVHVRARGAMPLVEALRLAGLEFVRSEVRDVSREGRAA